MTTGSEASEGFFNTGDLNEGADLRDKFAIAAMQGICVNAQARHEEHIPELCKTIAKMAYQVADAMLAARKL